MNTSEQTGNLAAAEAAAQAELGVAIMDKKNPHFKSDYLSHKGAVEVILPTYAKHGISITQCFRMSGDMLILDTRFTHKSGEWRESEYPVCKFPERPQTIAANGTYAKRLSLVAMACLAADIDDDGNEANKTRVEAPPAKQPPKPTIGLPESKVVYDALAQSLIMAQTVQEADQWMSDNLEAINGLHDDHKAMLRRSIKDIRQSLAKAA